MDILWHNLQHCISWWMFINCLVTPDLWGSWWHQTTPLICKCRNLKHPWSGTNSAVLKTLKDGNWIQKSRFHVFSWKLTSDLWDPFPKGLMSLQLKSHENSYHCNFVSPQQIRLDFHTSGVTAELLLWHVQKMWPDHILIIQIRAWFCFCRFG